MRYHATGTTACNLLLICIVLVAIISSTFVLDVSCNAQNNNSNISKIASLANTRGSNASRAINRKNVAIKKEIKNVNVNNEENTNISMKEKNNSIHNWRK